MSQDAVELGVKEYHTSLSTFTLGAQPVVGLAPSSVAVLLLPLTPAGPVPADGTSEAAAQVSFNGGGVTSRWSGVAPAADDPLDATRTLYVVLAASVAVTADRGAEHGLPAASSLHASSVRDPHAPLYTVKTLSIPLLHVSMCQTP